MWGCVTEWWGGAVRLACSPPFCVYIALFNNLHHLPVYINASGFIHPRSTWTHNLHSGLNKILVPKYCTEILTTTVWGEILFWVMTQKNGLFEWTHIQYKHTITFGKYGRFPLSYPHPLSTSLSFSKFSGSGALWTGNKNYLHCFSFIVTS